MLNSNDFDQLGYESILSKAQSRDCTWYFFEFRDFRTSAEASEEKQHLAALSLFQKITSYIFNLQDITNPLDHMASWFEEGRRTGTGHPQQLTSEELEYLSEVIEQIQDAELKARLADILWVRKFKSQARKPLDWARLAIDTYMESAKTLLGPENWFESKQRSERALQIALQLRDAGKEQLQMILDSIDTFLARYMTSDKDEVKSMFVALLVKYKLYKAEHLGDLEDDAQRAFEQLNFGLAKRVWKNVAEIYAQQHEVPLKKAALIKAAYCMVEESKLKARGNELLPAIAILKDAIDDLIRLELDKHKLEELHILLLDFQSRWSQSAPIVEFRTEKAPMERAFQDIHQQLENKSVLEALIILSLNCQFLNKDHLSEMVADHSKSYVFSQFARTFHTTKKGKVLNELMGDGGKDSETTQHILNSRLNQQARYHFQVIGLALQAGADKILEDHYVTADDFLPIVLNNPFVPKGRESIFAQGLYYGLIGDYLLSSHLLIPQLENSFRGLLEAANVPTSRLAIHQPQTEHSFEKTINHPKMKELFPDDVVFTLMSLLSNVDSSGTNLRNELCHGLLDTGHFNSPYHVYAWGLALRLCCEGFLQLISLVEASQDGETSAEDVACLDTSDESL